MRMSQIEAQRNNAFYLVFPLQEADAGADNFKTGASPAVTAYFKDAAGAWTSFVPANAIAEIASTGMYSLDLTAAEMDHDQVLLKFTAATAFDDAVLLRTVGVRLADGVAHGGTPGSSAATLALANINVTSSSSHAMELHADGSTSIGLLIDTNGINAHAVSLQPVGGGANGLRIETSNAAAVFIEPQGAHQGIHIESTGEAIWARSSGADGVVFRSATDNGLQIISLGTGTAALRIEAPNAAGVRIAAITESCIELEATGTAHGIDIRATGSTGDGIHIESGGHGMSISNVGGHAIFVTGGTDSDGIRAVGQGTGVGINSTPEAVGFGVLAANGLNSVLIAEPSAPPAFGTGTIVEFVGWLGALSRNEVVVTKTGPGVGTQVVKDDAGTADIGTSSVSRTASLSTRGKFS